MVVWDATAPGTETFVMGPGSPMDDSRPQHDVYAARAKPVPQYMEGDPLVNADRLLSGVLDGREPHDPMRRGHLADLEVALAEVRRAAADRDNVAWGELGLAEERAAHAEVERFVGGT